MNNTNYNKWINQNNLDNIIFSTVVASHVESDTEHSTAITKLKASLRELQENAELSDPDVTASLLYQESETSSFLEAFPKYISSKEYQEAFINSKKYLESLSGDSTASSVSTAIKENGLLEVFKDLSVVGQSDETTLVNKVDAANESLNNLWTNPLFHIEGSKLIIDHAALSEKWNHVSEVLANSHIFEVGFNPVTLISAGLTYKAVMSGYSKAAFYSNKEIGMLKYEDKLMRMRNVRAFAIGGAPLIVAFLIVLAKTKPLASININTTISVDNATSATQSFIGLGLLKSPEFRVLALLLPLIVSIKFFFPELWVWLDEITLTGILKFSLIWISLFVLYYGIQLLVAQSIVVSKDITNLNLPRYLPKFIKNDYNNLNIVIHQNKEKTISYLMRNFAIYLVLLITFIILSLIF